MLLHYLKDANIFSNRTKPYIGLHGLNMRTHQNIYANNAVLSAIFSINIEEEKQ